MNLKSFCVSLAVGALVAGCARSATTGGVALSGAPDMSPTPPTPDPRIGLHPGWFDAGTAIWNLRAVSMTRPSKDFINESSPGDRRLVNSDLAFTGNYVFQGNYSGWQVWDISNPSKPRLETSYVCPGSQSDVSVYHNLLFVSAEATNGRVDCGLEGVADTVSKERARGVRIIDISDIAKPKYITTVQTCRGSHTHTVVTDPNDASNVYVYVSGSAPVRSSSELPGCSNALPEEDPNSALFRIEVIQVPLAHPEQSHVVSSPRIFDSLTAPAKHAEMPADIAARDSARAAAARSGQAQRPQRQFNPALAQRGPTQCHDITVYPAIGLAGGACAGYGLLLDIHDVAHPKRIGAVADSNFSFWHSATFSNDGSKVLFSDEWGGGSQPRCRATDHHEWGADAIFTIAGNEMKFQNYYKMSAPQTRFENCVAHNGSLIPVPGRDIMVQAWYQGGISVFDWSDPAHPIEIAYFDRGPMDSTKLVDGGYWSAYWYNGHIVGSEISRGLDVFDLQPSAYLSQNEIDAAKSVHFDQLNVQDQPKIVWPASFVVARAYVDQLVRRNGIARDRSSEIAAALDRAEKASGADRRTALSQLATQLQSDASGASDQARVRKLADVVSELANKS
jgi:LVIVD repeat-containing protein